VLVSSAAPSGEPERLGAPQHRRQAPRLGR